MSQVKRARKVTSASAVANLADAVREMGAMLASDANSEQSPAQRLTLAIRTVASDDNLTREQRLKVMRLFRADVNAADAYLAIHDDAQLRTDFILGELNLV